MINFQDLDFIITNPVFPENSLAYIEMSIKIVVDKNDSYIDLSKGLSRILVGKNSAENPTQLKYNLDSSNPDSFKLFISEQCKIKTEELDLYTDIADVTFSAELVYSNLHAFTEEEIKSIKKLKIKSIFGSYVIV